MDPSNGEPPSAMRDLAIEAFRADLTRVARGKTRRGLARKMGYSHARLSDMLSPRWRGLPPWDAVETYLRACGVSAEDIARDWRPRWYKLHALEPRYTFHAPVRAASFVLDERRVQTVQEFGRHLSRDAALVEAGENLLEAVLVVLRHAAQASTDDGQGGPR
ncbi:helix-turn-helix domain-containing protein [Streptodolium elevatio]|uniref:Helix-turn-helix transcriptional regulator n=1 Tax=Streptodolium elevatio TaxID=3157996 RepID=A0ABV3DLC6_9ACTN